MGAKGMQVFKDEENLRVNSHELHPALQEPGRHQGEGCRKLRGCPEGTARDKEGQSEKAGANWCPLDRMASRTQGENGAIQGEGYARKCRIVPCQFRRECAKEGVKSMFSQFG